MLFTEEWLRSFINPALNTEELAEKLTMAGLEVEEVKTVAPAFTNVVVGEVKTCRDHENSDHLHVCTVDAGTGEILPIVCGAPNVRAGIRVACALEGAEMPGGFKIKKAKLRGEVSRGMLCSVKELGVAEESDGIWILPDDAPIGMSIREYAGLDDAVIEIKLTPNRGDALSVLGVARDLEAMTQDEIKLPSMEPVEPTCTCVKPVRVEAPDLCGRFTGRVIRNLNPDAVTPDWMKRRLERSGMHPKSALIDISNYVMLELGQPSHFYDLKSLEADELVVRWARKDESIELLNDEKVELDPYYGVVCDGERPVTIAGIMGGRDASVKEGTTDVYVEVAFWQQEAIQGRARRLNFSTDASHRYERGVDFGRHVEYLERITRLVLEICGTPETKVGPVDDHIVDLPRRDPVKMRVERCLKVIGMPIPVEAMHDTFKHLGFEYSFEDGVFTVVPPTHRFDIEIEEDLIEEVARLYGYEKLPDRPPMARIAMKSPAEASRSAHQLRLACASLGYQELVNFSFVPEEWELDFAGNDKPIRLRNPIASHLSVMRTNLVGNLVDILKYNLNRKATDVRVFELGRVFIPDVTVLDGPWSVKGVRQPLHIGGLAYGDAYPAQWGEKVRPVDFYDVKGDVQTLIAPLAARFVKETFPGLHPGRSAAIFIGEQKVGFIGELHPALVQKYDLPRAPIVFELLVEPLMTLELPHHEAPSKFQPLRRDLSVVVPAETEVFVLLDAVRQARFADVRLANLGEFKLFDLYRKDGSDEKSLAFSVEIVSRGDEPVSEAAVEDLMKALVETLGQVGAKLRA